MTTLFWRMLHGGAQDDNLEDGLIELSSDSVDEFLQGTITEENSRATCQCVALRLTDQMYSSSADHYFISWCASLIGLQAEAPTSRFRTSIQSNNILQNQQPVPCLPYPSRDGLCISSENLVFIIVQGFFKSIADIVRTLKCPATLQLPTPIHATSWSTYWTDL